MTVLSLAVALLQSCKPDLSVRILRGSSVHAWYDPQRKELVLTGDDSPPFSHAEKVSL